MAHFWKRLRSGEWLTASRVRGYRLILPGVCAIAVVGWIALSEGLIDRNGKPVGTDFSNTYAADTLARWQADRHLRTGTAIRRRGNRRRAAVAQA